MGRAIVTVAAGGPTADEPRRAAWAWYPAQPGSADGAPRVDYLPDGWSGPSTLPPTVGPGWLLQDVGAVTAWARRDAPPASGPAPVVVLAPGFETAPWRYTTLDEELASRGRVVALLVPPTTPARVVDGRQRTSPAAPATPTGAEVDTQIHRQAADMTALLDAFISADSPAPGPVDTRRTSSPPTSTATIAGAGHNAFGDPVHYFVAPPAGAAAGIGDIPAHRMHIVLTSTLDTTIDELLHNGRIVDPSTATDLPELVRGSG